MGLALKSLACLTRLKGNDVEKKKKGQGHKPGLSMSTVIHMHKGDQRRDSRALLTSVNHKCLSWASLKVTEDIFIPAGG